MSTLQAIIAAIAITFIMGILFGLHILYRRYLIKDRKEVEEQKSSGGN